MRRGRAWKKRAHCNATASLPLWACIPRVYIWNNELERAKDAICERPLIVLLCPALLTHTQNTEKRTARSLSVSPSVTQVRGFFPLTFMVSSASGLFFTLVCSTYLLTSRVLVNVGFVQTWCLVECDSACRRFSFSFLNRQLALTSFFLLHTLSVWHFLAVFHKKKEVVV